MENATPLEKVLSAIGDYKKAGDGYQARCPAHEDRKPSLSINEAEDTTVLLKCHAGCSTEAVV
jgi:putative DNA primase/helicase